MTTRMEEQERRTEKARERRATAAQFMGEGRLMGTANEYEWLLNAPMRLPPTRLDEQWLERAARIPRVDVLDRGDAFKVKIDLPGTDRKDVRVRVTKNSINVAAYGSDEHEEIMHDFYTKERSSEGYYRVIRLPEEIEGKTARAKFANGLLQIEVKKAEGSLASEVEVE